MKIGLILLLAAGPFVVRAQKPGSLSEGPGTLIQRAGGLFSANPLDSLLLPWHPPTVLFPGRLTGWGPRTIYDDRGYTPFPENLHWPGQEKIQMSLYAQNSIRIMMPDHMPCLVPVGIFDKMPRKMRFCCEVDKMPDGYQR